MTAYATNPLMKARIERNMAKQKRNTNKLKGSKNSYVLFLVAIPLSEKILWIISVFIQSKLIYLQ